MRPSYAVAGILLALSLTGGAYAPAAAVAPRPSTGSGSGATGSGNEATGSGNEETGSGNEADDPLAWQDCTRTFDGVRLSVAATQKTVTIVIQTSETHARVAFYVRTEGACSFDRKFRTRTARIGWAGTVAGSKRKQGSGKTPRGTYTMTEAFGNGSAPPTAMPWHTVRKGDYWVGDNKSDYYNTLRNKADGGFRWRLPSSHVNSSEKLRSFPHQYRYVVVINFNRGPDVQRHYRGYGIFLHVKSSGPTAGCVGVTAKQMRIVLADLQPGDPIKIVK